MTDIFNSYIEHIDRITWRELCVSKGLLRHLSKGEEFVSIGSVGRYIGFIESGTLKYTAYGDDGTEHVMGLIFSEEFVADWPFCIYGQKAQLAIVATSECEIYCIPTKEVVKMMQTDQNLKNAVMQVTEAVFSTVYERYIDLYVKTPRQRYEDLVNRHPDLFNLFSLKEIASFLNITPTHLSRLRKQVEKTR